MEHDVDDLIRRLEAEIPDAIDRLGVPGLAVGICDVNDVLWCAGYGTTRRTHGRPITPATRFSVQSTSKLFTAATVLLAVQQGLVNLDEPIRTYVPEFTVKSVFDDAPSGVITLRHCLSHTAGFTHEAPSGSNYDLGDGDFDTHCRSISDTWLRFPVGHHYEYSNLGIDLAGYALQRASGIPFRELTRRALLAPLGLDRTTFDPAVVEADADRAIGHWRPFEQAGRPLPVAVPMVPSGGLYTTLSDALRFVQFYLRSGESLLASALIDEQFRVPFSPDDQKLGYGLGVYVDEWCPGLRVHHHGGSGFGFQAQLCWVPELELGAVVLTNSFDHSLQNEICHTMVEHMACRSSRRSVPAPHDAPATRAPRLDGADELVGEYVGRLNDRYEIDVHAGRLLFTEAETREAHLIATRTIELGDPPHERYRFAEGRDGAVAYMLAVRDGQTKYRNDAHLTPSSMMDTQYEGTYEVLVWGMPVGRYRIEQRGSSPVIEKLSDSYGDGSAQPIALRLAPIERGLYVSSMGEMLDLRSTPPTYANIPLVKVESAPDRRAGASNRDGAAASPARS